MSEKRLKIIKENVYMRSEIAKNSRLGIDTSLREELELLKEIDRLNNKVKIIQKDNEIEKGLKLYKDYLKDLEGDGCENYHNVTETQYLHRLSIIINELIDEVNALKENNK